MGLEGRQIPIYTELALNLPPEGEALQELVRYLSKGMSGPRIPKARRSRQLLRQAELEGWPPEIPQDIDTSLDFGAFDFGALESEDVLDQLDFDTFLVNDNADDSLAFDLDMNFLPGPQGGGNL